ncbi:CHAT domain-containing protein [Aquibium sp. ELW1220]|uniref:CHAT domain-containing protein n=1 Tax=Aquibium sp. ELW1220 TaxID=2976766 RepID=UPI0025B066A4|nr:CHAT domain-containing protein [Aquibium sp. ELW1220]MDN2583771.1 CHAT domain-containing protein [Aquibium sp. ELW1220]
MEGVSDETLGRLLGNLGVALRNAAEAYGDRHYYDDAVDVNRRACSIAGDELANWGRRLNLAMALFWRFQAWNTDDVEEMRHLLDSVYDDADSPDKLAQVASDRAVVEHALFSRSGLHADLERAIFYAEGAIAQTRPGHSALLSRMNNLGMCLATRFHLLGTVDDGRRGVNVLREALDATPKEHIEFPMRALNLGNAQMAIYLATYSASDLGAAVAAYEAAHEAVGHDHSFKPSVDLGLAQALTRLAVLEGKTQVLDRAVALAFSAVGASVGQPVQRSTALSAAAAALQERARLSGYVRDAQAAVLALQEATELSEHHRFEVDQYRVAHLQARQLSARMSGDHAALLHGLKDGLELLETVGQQLLVPGGALGLADRIGLTRRELIADALAISEVALAVELIEQGKAASLRQSMRREDRVPSHLDVEGRATFVTMARRLRALDAFLAVSDLRHSSTATAELMAEAEALQKALIEVEAVDPDRLRPTAWSDVASLAATLNASLIYVVPGQDGEGAAVIVHPKSLGRWSQQDVVSLKNLTHSAVAELLTKGASTLPADLRDFVQVGSGGVDTGLGFLVAYGLYRNPATPEPMRQPFLDVWKQKLVSTLEWIDEFAIGPVVDRLEKLGAARVILIPDGQLSSLPLHAAASFRSAFNDVSYAPSAGVVRSLSERRLPPETGNNVFVGTSDSSLPFASAEVRMLSELIKGGGGTVTSGKSLRWLKGVSATADRIFFCGHAYFNPGDPLSSQILLDGDAQLTLAALRAGAIDLRKGATVCLNACETGMVQARLASDEQLGFPTAFLLSGANFVMGSLWVANDLASVIFARELLRNLLSGVSNPESISVATKRLQNLTKDEAIGMLGEMSETARLSNRLRRRLSETIAAGPETPFAHPSYWACFTANGI